MANCSIPNSSPANGRISTRSLRRSRKQNSHTLASVSVIRRLACSLQKQRQVRHVESVVRRTAALQSALSARKIQRWTLDVGRWVFLAIWRVNGAWWPSRSSKPPSSRLAGRDRFDSYPLRHLIFDLRFSIFDCTVATALRAVQAFEGGDLRCPVSRFAN
jgi:hypothetical protein